MRRFFKSLQLYTSARGSAPPRQPLRLAPRRTGARCLEVASTATGSVYIKKRETIRRGANALVQMRRQMQLLCRLMATLKVSANKKWWLSLNKIRVTVHPTRDVDRVK